MTTAAATPRELEALVTSNMPLVGHLVREMLSRVPAHVNRDDLCSAGFAALVTAARAFDPLRGIPFVRFSAMRIRGALVDELRGLDWASRSVRQRARRSDATRQELTGALGRTPTDTEVAEVLGIGLSELTAVQDDVQRAVVLSLQGFAVSGAEDMITERAAGPEELLLHRERVGYLHDAIDALPERLRTVITASFLLERPLAEIAADLAVTESRISQLRTEALTLLRDGMNSHLDPALVDEPQRPENCVTRRRTAYFEKVGNQGTLRTRLDMTNHYGLPIALAS